MSLHFEIISVALKEIRALFLSCCFEFNDHLVTHALQWQQQSLAGHDTSPLLDTLDAFRVMNLNSNG